MSGDMFSEKKRVKFEKDSKDQLQSNNELKQEKKPLLDFNIFKQIHTFSFNMNPTNNSIN